MGTIQRCGANDWRAKRCGANDWRLKRCAPLCAYCPDEAPAQYSVSVPSIAFACCFAYPNGSDGIVLFSQPSAILTRPSPSSCSWTESHKMGERWAWPSQTNCAGQAFYYFDVYYAWTLTRTAGYFRLTLQCYWMPFAYDSGLIATASCNGAWSWPNVTPAYGCGGVPPMNRIGTATVVSV